MTTTMKKTVPNLFIRNISINITRDAVWSTISNLGFGIIHNIIMRNGKNDSNNAIVYYEQWNVDQTEYIRRMLCSGKSLNISYDYESTPWKVYKYEEDMNEELPDILYPNVTDNRKQRKNRLKEDKKCYAPRKPLRDIRRYHSQNHLDSVRKSLFLFPEME